MKVFRLALLSVLFAAISLLVSGVLAWDRQIQHEERLNGLDLSVRSISEPNRFKPAGVTSAEDIMVSQSLSPARFDQDRADVVKLNDGGWWLVWDDDRQGSRKIFGQKMNASGEPTGSNQLLAEATAGANLVDPRLGVDTLGRIFLAFRDQTRGTITLERFDVTGTLDWGPILVNDTTLNSFAGPFDLTLFPDGQVVLAWEDYSALGSTIAMRIFTATGNDFLGPVVVNSDGGSANHWVPNLACAPGSGFVVVWEDYRNGRADIYARQFTGAGVAVGADFTVVPSPENGAHQFAPQIVYSILDRYVVGWTDLRDGQEIYLQRYDQTIGLVGGNTLISSGHELVLNSDVELAVRSGGEVDALWSASGADNAIQHLELDSGLVPAGLPEVVNVQTLGQRWAPAAAIDTDTNLAVVWTDVINDNANITLMLYDPQGEPRLVSELVVNDDTLGAHSSAPVVVATSFWWNLVGFVDCRRDQGDIMVRGIAVDGQFAADEVRVNDDEGAALQAEPSLAVSNSRALVVWTDGRTLNGFSGQRIFGRFLTLTGDLESSEFLISDSLQLAVKTSPGAAMLADGFGLVAWLDRRGGTPQVYARWLTTSGTIDGDELLISDPTSDLSIQNLFVGEDGSRIYVIWLEVSGVEPVVRVNVFDNTQTMTTSFEFTPATTTALIDQLSAGVGPDGSVSLFWTGMDNGIRKGYVSRLASDGSVVVDADPVIDVAAAVPTQPSVSISNNNYLSLTWVDQRDGQPTIYYQILDAGLDPVIVMQPVSTSAPEFMQQPHTDAYRGRAWFVWSDPRNNGLNIYANPVVYLPTGIDDDPELLPGKYYLAQNYPNPFNPSTDIEYYLPVAADVKLTVLNLLGRRVARLVSVRQSSGLHTVTWNGCDNLGQPVASGVYLYRLTTDSFASTRKMVLLK